MIVVVFRIGDQELVYDTDDIEYVDYSTPRNTVSLGAKGATFRVQGEAHLYLDLEFKDGKYPYWRAASEGDAILPPPEDKGEWYEHCPRSKTVRMQLPDEVARQVANLIYPPKEEPDA